jgi:hypothetical protein
MPVLKAVVTYVGPYCETAFFEKKFYKSIMLPKYTMLRKSNIINT